MNEERQIKLLEAMTEFDGGNPLRIQHFLKVWGFARQIGKMEGIDLRTQEILETAAIVHDIGIKVSLEKYGDCTGKHQEMEGAPLAEKMLIGLDYERALVERVSWLVGHHHTYGNVKEADHQILLEADFLVNSYESSESTEVIQTFMQNVFYTHSGIRLLKLQWGLH